MALSYFFVYFCFLLHFGYQLENCNIEKMHHSVFLHYTQTGKRWDLTQKEENLPFEAVHI